MPPGFLVTVRLDGPSSPSAGDGGGALRFEVAAGAGSRLARAGESQAVADVRLDNRVAVRAALAAEVGREIGPDDADLVLAAVEVWGAEAAAHLDGPAAFVAWDARRRTLVASRDALGRRPLYRATGDGVVRFSDRIATLRPYVSGALDRQAAADGLAGVVDASRRTALSGIERVPPAHTVAITWEGGTARQEERRFWSLARAPRDEIGDAEAAEAFREAFDRSVAARLADGAGAFLSGGLDSSSIVATARRLCPDAPLPTLSLLYEEKTANERRYVDAVADHVGVEPHRIDGGRLSLLDGLDADLEAVGEPFFTPNLFITRSLYAEAHRRGLGVVLDGFGGDNVVGYGDRRLTELAYGLRWPTFAREVAAAARRSSRPRRMAAQLLGDYVVTPLVAPLRREPPPLSFAAPGLPPPARPSALSRWSDRSALQRDLAGPTLARAFEVAYAVARAHGVDPRFPFADRALVELSVSLPSRQRLQDGLTRSVLRRAMAGRLPDALLQRTDKARLAHNFVDALFVRDPEALRRLVYDDVPRVPDVLDVAAVQAAYRRAVDDEAARSEVALPLWRAVAWARWRTLDAR